MDLHFHLCLNDHGAGISCLWFTISVKQLNQFREYVSDSFWSMPEVVAYQMCDSSMSCFDCTHIGHSWPVWWCFSYTCTSCFAVWPTFTRRAFVTVTLSHRIYCWTQRLACSNSVILEGKDWKKSLENAFSSFMGGPWKVI